MTEFFGRSRCLVNVVADAEYRVRAIGEGARAIAMVSVGNGVAIPLTVARIERLLDRLHKGVSVAPK